MKKSNEILFTVHGRLPQLNDVIRKTKAGFGGYSQEKKKYTKKVHLEILSQVERGVKIRQGYGLELKWYVKNRLRDPDNIAFAVKYILDGMVAAGIVKDDGFWYLRGGIEHQFYLKGEGEKERVEVKVFETSQGEHDE